LKIAIWTGAVIRFLVFKRGLSNLKKFAHELFKSGVMKNLRRILFCAVLLLTVAAFKGFAQAPEWEWAKSMGCKGYNAGTSMTTDSQNNVYSAGFFECPFIVFGSDTLFNTEKDAGQSYYGKDIFLAKFSPEGNIIWSKSFGGKLDDLGHQIITDANDNVYLTGTITSSFSIDTFLVESFGAPDFVIMKFNSDGKLLWVESVGGDKSDEAFDLTLDKEGNLFITGKFSSPRLNFDGIIIENQDENYPNIFVAKYGNTGNILWAKSFNSGISGTITTDLFGNCFITGYSFNPVISFDHITLDTGSLFVTKLDKNGNVLWAKRGKYGSGSSLKADEHGNVYVAGSFSGKSLILEDRELPQTSPFLSISDIFFAKYDSSGTLLWAKSFGGTDDERVDALLINTSGNVYLAGSFHSNEVNFDSIIVKRNGWVHGSTSDIFIAKFDTNGKAMWATSAGGDESETIMGITSDNEENLFISGNFSSPTFTLGKTTLTNEFSARSHIFIAKLSNQITSVSEEVKNDVISLFPNPTANQFHISIPEPGNWTITIYTLDGQPVFKKELTEANAMIDLSGKAKGAYMYQLLKDGEVFKTGKIVLE
jgi:hypothetical protein